ncbi:MAG: hypothetical protein JJU31_16690 [Wenzhouxiangella sp.]|nr:hypothetical protein [Wenzhouxiangella sp.]MCH8478292.1 hypothetical protein [Wenzhouxiangella sp.]
MRLIILLLCVGLVACAGTPEAPVPEPEAPPPVPEARGSAPLAPEPQRDPEPSGPREEPLQARELEVPREPAPTRPLVEPETPERLPPEPEIIEDARPAAVAPTGTVAGSASIAGSIEVLRNGRPLPFAATFLGQTVVAWRPADGVETPPLPEQTIVTRRSRFFPQTMAITSGTSVRFPNMDTIEHNVFSLTPGHRFDVGLYGQGQGRTHRFDGTGTVELFCNVHPNMAAFLLVLDTPFFASPDDEGNFKLDGLPAGPGELLVWNYRADQPLQRMTLSADEATASGAVVVDITRPTVPQHTNKHGESYRQSRR